MLPTEHFVSQIQSSTGVILSPFYGLSIFSPQIYFLPTITKYHFFFYQIQEWKRHWPQGCTFQSSVLSLKFPICCPDSSLPQSIYVLFNSDETVMISPTVMGITSITSFPYPCFEHYWAISKTSSKHPFALNQLPWLLSDCHVRNQVSTIAFETFETWSLCLQPQNTVFPLFLTQVQTPPTTPCFSSFLVTWRSSWLSIESLHALQDAPGASSISRALPLSTKEWSHIHVPIHPSICLASKPAILEMFNMHYGCWSFAVCRAYLSLQNSGHFFHEFYRLWRPASEKHIYR